MNASFIARMLIVFGILAASVAFVANAALAKNDEGTRPGWGYGDQNHDHTGPPGQSVNPTNTP
jgi:hypothetical protein